MAVANCPFTGAALTLHEQPYDKEPDRSPTLRPASVEPFNGEPALPLLVQSFLTPTPQFFVRNHSAVPHIDPSTYRLEVAIGGGSAADAQPRSVLSLSLSELRGEDTSRFRFRAQTMTCTLQCAGNRRTEMNAVHKVKGLGWGAGAVGNATWMGVWLRDVLSAAATGRLPAEGEAVNGRTLLRGVGSESGAALHHVEFEGWDGVKEHDFRGQGYASSVPLGKCTTLVETPLLRRSTTTTALQEEDGESPSVAGVMLAFAMNGAPLTADHGAPLRWWCRASSARGASSGCGACGCCWSRGGSRPTFPNTGLQALPALRGLAQRHAGALGPRHADSGDERQLRGLRRASWTPQQYQQQRRRVKQLEKQQQSRGRVLRGCGRVRHRRRRAAHRARRRVRRRGRDMGVRRRLFVRDGFSWGLWRARRIPVAVRRAGNVAGAGAGAGAGARARQERESRRRVVVVVVVVLLAGAGWSLCAHGTRPPTACPVHGADLEPSGRPRKQPGTALP